MRVFECDVCGVKTIAPKMTRKTAIGHKKDFYCFKCQGLTKHTQIED